MKFSDEKMWEPKKDTWSIEDCWIELVSTRKVKNSIRWVNPHGGWCMRLVLGKGRGSCKSSTVLGGDEWLDSFTEVAIEPVRHVIRLLEPSFGFSSSN